MQSVNRECHYVARSVENFAVYLGDGRYVQAVSASRVKDGHAFGFVHTDDLGGALSLSRSEAVAACHSTRRAGVPAWIVRHPVGALA